MFAFLRTMVKSGQNTRRRGEVKAWITNYALFSISVVRRAAFGGIERRRGGLSDLRSQGPLEIHIHLFKPDPLTSIHPCHSSRSCFSSRLPPHAFFLFILTF